MRFILEQMQFVQEYKMKTIFFILSLLFLIPLNLLSEQRELNIAVPVEFHAPTNSTVEANLPRTDADFSMYIQYWKKQSEEALNTEIESLQEFIITEGELARKTRIEYERAYLNFVPENNSERLTALREKEKQLESELNAVRQAIRNEVIQSPEVKELSEINLRHNLNVRHARLALKSLQQILSEKK